MSEIKHLVLPARDNKPVFEYGSVFFVGTATIILRYAGFTILTDPNFLHKHQQVHIGYGLRSTRLTDPAIEFEQLPEIDLVILSHLHEDHFDRIVAQKLDKSLPIITTHQAANKLRKKGFSGLMPLDTWQSVNVIKGAASLRITSMPGQHAPGIITAAMPSVMGSMLEFKNVAGKTTFHLYITGDTLLVEQLKEIPQRYPHIDLALLHLGGTRVMGLLLTMDAKQGVEALKLMQSDTAIPIHYNDYTVFKSPLEDFKQAATEAGLDKQLHYLSHGDTYNFEVPASRLQVAI